MTISKKRAALLRELENIVGWSFYNRKTQNYGPGGRFEGQGREIRYPITFTDSEGGKSKRSTKNYEDLPTSVQLTGSYVVGANELHIMQSLDEVLQFLEKNYGLKL